MKHRVPAGEGRTWPERMVVRTGVSPMNPKMKWGVSPMNPKMKWGVSPMNPKMKWAELSCGHDVFRNRRPKIGSTIVCDKCSELAAK